MVVVVLVVVIFVVVVVVVLSAAQFVAVFFGVTFDEKLPTNIVR